MRTNFDREKNTYTTVSMLYEDWEYTFSLSQDTLAEGF
jgi:hypothetical protein